MLDKTSACIRCSSGIEHLDLVDGVLPGTCGVVPCTADGTPTIEVLPSTVVYGLLLAGWRNVEVYNYVRARYTSVPTFLWYTADVTPGYVVRKRLELVDAKLVPRVAVRKPTVPAQALPDSKDWQRPEVKVWQALDKQAYRLECAERARLLEEKSGA